MKPTSEWIFEFDYLRTIAILLILISHGFGIFGGATMSPPLNSYITFLGSMGVILFLFISGFLISKHSPENLNSLINFFKDRILRIGPLYWCALFLTSLLYFFNIYQGFWIKDFNLFNIAINSLFLSNFVPASDIPPFWFISAIILFSLVYFVLRLFNKNLFYFTISSLFVYFLFLILEMSGILWATNAFIYFIIGILLGMLYYANVFTLGKITYVPVIVSLISKSSYSVYLFHLIFFGILLKILNFLLIKNFFLQLSISIVVTICLSSMIQYFFDAISNHCRKIIGKSS